jgi:membrane fusion protein, heavy metal efflux system
MRLSPVANQPTRPRKSPSAALLPAVALAAVVLVAVWFKGEALREAVGWNRQHGAGGASDLAAAPDKTPGADEFRTQVKLASAEVAKDLGIELMPVESRTVERTITCNGRASFNENRYAHLRARVEGIVHGVRSDVGAKLRAGDVLALVDSPMLGDIKSAYINSLSRRDQLQWDYDRQRKLVEDQAIPVKSFRETQALYAQQQTTTANARQQLLNFGFKSDEIDALAESKDTSTELPLVAPWDGVVVARHAVEGELAERNAPLFGVADLRIMWVHLNLYESDMDQVRLGQPVTFAADGLPDVRFAGLVGWISPEIDARTRTTQVRAEVTNTGNMLRANMFGKGQIVVQSSRDSLVVPPSAVQTYRERSIVFVRESDDAFAVRPITVGIKSERYWEVLSGVERGEQVATTGSFLLKSDIEKEKLGDAD